MNMFGIFKRKNAIYRGGRLSVVSVAVLIAGCGSYDQYVPVELVQSGRNPEFRVRPELDTPDFQKAFISILNRYDVPYKMADGKLLIPRDLATDKELLANYTAKAEDELAKAATNPDPGKGR